MEKTASEYCWLWNLNLSAIHARPWAEPVEDKRWVRQFPTGNIKDKLVLTCSTQVRYVNTSGQRTAFWVSCRHGYSPVLSSGDDPGPGGMFCGVLYWGFLCCHVQQSYLIVENFSSCLWYTQILQQNTSTYCVHSDKVAGHSMPGPHRPLQQVATSEWPFYLYLLIFSTVHLMLLPTTTI